MDKMAKKIIYVEQHILDKIANVDKRIALRWETDKAIYYAIGGPYDKGITEMPKPKLTHEAALKLFQSYIFADTNDAGRSKKWLDFFIDAGMLEVKEEEEEKPVFEIINHDAYRHIKIYADGRISGITGTVINRIPELLTKCQNNS